MKGGSNMVLKHALYLAVVGVLTLGSGKKAAGFDGYILAGGFGAGRTVLLDQNNDTIYKWDHAALANLKNGYSSYLLNDGTLLRSAVTNNTEISANAQPTQGVINAIDPQGALIWTYELANLKTMLHHDFKMLPNGNVLVVAFEETSKAEAVAKGIDSTLFTPVIIRNGTKRDTTYSPVQTERILEVKLDVTGGTNHQIVWEWNILDHIVPKNQAAAHPEKFSGGLGPFWAGQWVHLNGIDYYPDKDLIAFTSRIFSEVYILDHSTTTAQAATGTGGKFNKGGDLLFRWGHAENYGVEAEGKEIYTLHCPTWIPKGYANEGDIMFFHNNAVGSTYGFNKIGNSEVVEITPPVDAAGNFIRAEGKSFGPLAPTWIYAPSVTDSIYSMSMSTAIRMKNGNTIVHEAYPPAVAKVDSTKPGPVFPSAAYGGSRIREVKPDGSIVGAPFMLSVNAAKIMYYEKDAPCIVALLKNVAIRNNGQVGTQLVQKLPGVSFAKGALHFTNVEGAAITMYSLQGVQLLSITSPNATCTVAAKTVATGTYLAKIHSPEGAITSHTVRVW